MMKNKILRFVLHVLLPTRIITCILTGPSLERTFVSMGFSNWKDAIVKFSKHEGSQCHKDSVLKTVTLPTTSSDVGEMLSSQLARERMHRCKCFLKLLHSMLLHVHKSHTDHLNLVDVANDFISGSEHRKNVFGTEFKDSDLDFV